MSEGNTARRSSRNIVEAHRSDERLFFVILQKGHADIFDDERVEDYWLFHEDIMENHDLYFVVMKRLDARTRELVMHWRSLPFVYSVEQNQVDSRIRLEANELSGFTLLAATNQFTYGDTSRAQVPTISDHLETLAKLHHGLKLIDDDEFRLAKRKLLG